jgi:hypothetical protein
MTMTPVARATDPRIAGIAKNGKHFYIDDDILLDSEEHNLPAVNDAQSRSKNGQSTLIRRDRIKMSLF